MNTKLHTEENIISKSTDCLLNDFTQFYDEYFSKVYNYVYYRVNDSHDVDDLTSTIFYKLFEKRDYYCADKAPLFAWVFSIARNTITDYYRRRGRDTYIPLETIDGLLSSELGPEDIAEKNEVEEQLHRALRSLSDRERDIIALKFWSGLTNREIAKVTGLSESNIGVILFRVMRRIKHYMEVQEVYAYD